MYKPSFPCSRLRNRYLCAIYLATAGHVAAGDGSVIGTWAGTYTCQQGLTGLTLTISEATPTSVRALFHFYADPSNPLVPTGCFNMTGKYDATAKRLQLVGAQWLLQPRGYSVVDFDGHVDAAGTAFTGRVNYPGCKEFNLLKSSRTDSTRGVPEACVVEAPVYTDTTKVSGQIVQALTSKASIDLQVPFEFGKAALLPGAQLQLDELGRTLTSPEFVNRRVGIYGHTDSVGSDQANLQLSDARAAAVLQYLVRVFRVQPGGFVTKGFGRSRLKRPDQPGDAANRRVEVVLLP